MDRQEQIRQLQRQLNDIAKQLAALQRVEVPESAASLLGSANTWTGTNIFRRAGGFFVQRTGANTTDLSASLALHTETTGAMADGFGSGIIATAQDSDAVANNAGILGWVRDGADTTYKFQGYIYVAGVATKIIDWTSTGLQSPTIVTPIIAQIYGSAAANGDILIDGTSHATKTSSYVVLQPTGGNVGIGTTAPDYALEVSHASGPKLALSDPGLAHGVTTFAQTDTFFLVEQVTDNEGGARIWGFGTNASIPPLRMLGVHPTDPDDTVPAFWFLGAKRTGTTLTSLAADECVAAISNNGTNLVVFKGDGDVGIGTESPVAKLHVLQPTLGSVVQRLTSTATNDDPTEDVVQGRVTTTNNTATTIATIAIPASTTVGMEVAIVGRRTGGSAGVAEDGGVFKALFGYKNVAGTPTVLAGGTTYASANPAGWGGISTAVSGGNVLVQVTGATNVNIVWHATVRTYAVST